MSRCCAALPCGPCQACASPWSRGTCTRPTGKQAPGAWDPRRMQPQAHSEAPPLTPYLSLSSPLVLLSLHLLSGMLPGYISGFYSYDDCHIDLARLASYAKARLIHDEASGLDLAVIRATQQPALPRGTTRVQDLGGQPISSESHHPFFFSLSSHPLRTAECCSAAGPRWPMTSSPSTSGSLRRPAASREPTSTHSRSNPSTGAIGARSASPQSPIPLMG